jgi:hypothetical protein
MGNEGITQSGEDRGYVREVADADGENKFACGEGLLRVECHAETFRIRDHRYDRPSLNFRHDALLEGNAIRDEAIKRNWQSQVSVWDTLFRTEVR